MTAAQFAMAVILFMLVLGCGIALFWEQMWTREHKSLVAEMEAHEATRTMLHITRATLQASMAALSRASDVLEAQGLPVPFRLPPSDTPIGDAARAAVDLVQWEIELDGDGAA